MSRSPVVFFKKYGKPVLPFMKVRYFLLKIFLRAVQVGKRASVCFYFSGRTTSKENLHFI